MKIEKTKSPVAQNEATISSPNLQQAATTIDARNLQGFQNEQFREACDSADSALKSIIYDLIGKKRLIAAVGLIYTMKLFDKFPPVQILKEYVDNGKRCCRNRTKRKKSLDEKVTYISLLWIFNSASLIVISRNSSENVHLSKIEFSFFFSHRI